MHSTRTTTIVAVLCTACANVAAGTWPARPQAIAGKSTHERADSRFLPSADFSHFRDAIEGYVPTVNSANQRALETVRPAFAEYIRRVHGRIHPIFSDSFLAALDRLPPGHPLSDASLWVTIELAIDAEGRLARRGVLRPSGSTAFDICAIYAVERAAPFAPPPTQLLSSDGRVYLHWSFARDNMACSTREAQPYLLAL